MNEKWKDVVGYKGLYQVSNTGNIRSLDRPRSDKLYTHKGKQLKLQVDGRGYYFVNLWKDNKHKALRVHRLVLQAFVSEPPPGEYVNHRNGNRRDNHVENLEWVTPAENNLHAFRVLKRKPVSMPREKNAAAKLNNQDVEKIRRLRKENSKHWTFKRLGKMFGIVKSHVKRIVDLTNWK